MPYSKTGQTNEDSVVLLASEMADEILKRIRAGEAVTAEEFASGRPELQAELSELLPLMLAMEQIPRSAGSQSAMDSISSSAVDDTVVESLPAPQTLGNGRYKLLRVIGRGSMGTVYLAEDTTLERPVALKSPNTHSLDASAIKRFQHEAQIMAHVRHPQIASVYDLGKENGQYYMAMEYVPGKSLAELLETGRIFEPKDAVQLISNLADAVQCAHDSGVIHRDLKPANIIIDPDGQAYVTDFGLARAEQKRDAELTTSGSLLGSPAYMAPEQVTAQHDLVGPATDVYALGVILYQLLALKRPFEGSVYSVLEQVVASEPDSIANSRSGITPELEAICFRAIHKRIEDRYTSANAFSWELTRYLQHGPSTKPGKTNRVLRGALLLTGVLVLGIAGWGSWSFLGMAGLRRGDSGDSSFALRQDRKPNEAEYEPSTKLLPELAVCTKQSTGAFIEGQRFGKPGLSLAMADVDGDLDDDALVVSEQSFTLWLNDGQGGFTKSNQLFPSAAAPAFAEFGDLDANGTYDLVLTTEADCAVWLNIGSGEFVAHADHVPFEQPGRPSLGDIDQDGDLDVYLPCQSELHSDAILINDGQGNLSDFGIQLTGSTTRQVVLADLDADGDLDIYRVNVRAADDLWWNEGKNVFRPSEQSFAAALHSHAATACDLDDDQDIDLVVADNHLFVRGDKEILPAASRIWWNDGVGKFSTEKVPEFDRFVADVQTADLNGDSIPDLWAGRQQVFWGGKRPRQACIALRGSDHTPSYVGDAGAADGVLADLDGDGDIDCLSVGESGCAVWLNRNSDQPSPTSPVFVDSGGFSQDPEHDSNNVVLFDAEGDGDLDAFVTNFRAPNELWLNDGKGFFEKSDQSFNVLASAAKIASSSNMAVTAGDFDRDGDEDLVTSGLSIPLTLWKNDGAGNFEGILVSDEEPRDRYYLVAEDLNEDNALDLVVAVYGGPSEVWTNDGHASFQRTELLGDTNDFSIALGDLDGDRRPELLLGTLGPDLGINRWNGGINGFKAAEPIRTVSWASHVPSKEGVAVWATGIAVADFNEDGAPDVVGACSPYPSSVWLNDGTGQFLDQREILNHFGSKSVLAHDFDLDGHTDLFFSNDRSEPVEFVRGLGNGQFESPVLFHKRVACQWMQAGDLDQDGDLDVFCANKGANAVWLNHTK